MTNLSENKRINIVIKRALVVVILLAVQFVMFEIYAPKEVYAETFTCTFTCEYSGEEKICGKKKNTDQEISCERFCIACNAHRVYGSEGWKCSSDHCYVCGYSVESEYHKNNNCQYNAESGLCSACDGKEMKKVTIYYDDDNIPPTEVYMHTHCHALVYDEETNTYSQCGKETNTYGFCLEHCSRCLVAYTAVKYCPSCLWYRCNDTNNECCGGPNNPGYKEYCSHCRQWWSDEAECALRGRSYSRGHYCCAADGIENYGNYHYQHDWSATPYETIEPTCTTNGEIRYRCSNTNNNGRCGVIKRETIQALGHNFLLSEEKPAGCTNDGEMIYRCENIDASGNRCTETKIEIINATGHNYVLSETIPARMYY